MNKLFMVVLAGALLIYPRWDEVKQYVPTNLLPHNTPAVVITDTYGFAKTLPQTLPDPTQRAFVSGVFTGLADRIAADGKRDTPKLKYVAGIKDLGSCAVNIGLNGRSIGETAPQFGTVVAAVLNRELPDGTKQLDAQTRAKVVDIFFNIGEVLK